jgi:hypothetical protein
MLKLAHKYALIYESGIQALEYVGEGWAIKYFYMIEQYKNY